MKKLLIFLVAIIFWTVDIQAQGCSDAGFCTIGNLATNQHDSTRNNNSLRLTLTAGVGDEDVFVFTPALEYNKQFSPRWSAQAKATLNYASGNLGTAFGLGDVFLSGTYTGKTQKSWIPSVTLGVKLPLNQSTLEKGGRSLPMQYQSSLGTVDLIAGVSLNSPRWQLAAGWQQPLTGINRNHFLPEYWSNGKAINYPPSNDFARKGDVLFRSVYHFKPRRQVAWNVGLLGIYHLGEDTYINAAVQNEPIAIEGSQGLTLNVTGTLEWMLSPKWQLGITGGLPLIVRDVRPDGLTRSFVVAPQITYKF